MGVHDCRRRAHTDAHGDARDEQMRESKHLRSSSFILIGGAAFDGVVRRHRRDASRSELGLGFRV